MRLFDENQERGLHDAFEIGVVLKGIDGLLEFLGGVLLFLIPPDAIQRLILFAARRELAEDPRDAAVQALLRFARNLPLGAESFYAWLFVVHGAVKIFLVAGLWRGKRWAYPAAIAAFSLFVVYQVYELRVRFSWGLAAITLVDLAVIALTAHEYLYVKRRRREVVGPAELV